MMNTEKAYLHIDKRIPVLYICFYKKIYDTYRRLKSTLYSKEIIQSFRQYLTFNIPYNKNQLILKDLIYWGLIKKVSYDRYELQLDKFNNIKKHGEEYWAWG